MILKINPYAIPGLKREPQVDITKQVIRYIEWFCLTHEVCYEDLLGKRRTGYLVYLRHLCIHIIWEAMYYKNLSLFRLGKICNRNHATIIHSIRSSRNGIKYNTPLPKSSPKKLLSTYSTRKEHFDAVYIEMTS